VIDLTQLSQEDDAATPDTVAEPPLPPLSPPPPELQQQGEATEEEEMVVVVEPMKGAAPWLSVERRAGSDTEGGNTPLRQRRHPLWAMPRSSSADDLRATMGASGRDAVADRAVAVDADQPMALSQQQQQSMPQSSKRARDEEQERETEVMAVLSASAADSGGVFAQLCAQGVPCRVMAHQQQQQPGGCNGIVWWECAGKVTGHAAVRVVAATGLACSAGDVGQRIEGGIAMARSRCGSPQHVLLVLEGLPQYLRAMRREGGPADSVRCALTAVLTRAACNGRVSVVHAADAAATATLLRAHTRSIEAVFRRNARRRCNLDVGDSEGSASSLQPPSPLRFCAEAVRPSARVHASSVATWASMIEHVPRISAATARAVVSAFPTPASLLRALSMAVPATRESLLEGISVHSPASSSSRVIGPAAARRIVHNLCGDPSSPANV